MTQTTAKPAWYNRIGLIWQIVIGMIIGVLIGQWEITPKRRFIC